MLTHSRLSSLSQFVLLTGGGILLVEAMLFENRRGPVMAQIFSLNMLVQADGRERPPSEYTHMLNKSAFRNVQVCRTGKSYDAILAIKWAQIDTGTVSVWGRYSSEVWQSEESWTWTCQGLEKRFAQNFRLKKKAVVQCQCTWIYICGQPPVTFPHIVFSVNLFSKIILIQTFSGSQVAVG